MLTRLPWRTLGIAAAVLAVAVVPGAFEALSLDRAAVRAGEPWRLMTGHAVHATADHLLWNVVPLVLLGALFEPVLRGRLWRVLGGSALAVGAGVLALGAPGLDVYCGLSGVLNGLLVGGCLRAMREDRAAGRPAAVAVMAAAVGLALAKIGVEAWLGQAIFTDGGALGGRPVPLAHALGALGGLVALVRPDAGVAGGRAASGPAPSEHTDSASASLAAPGALDRRCAPDARAADRSRRSGPKPGLSRPPSPGPLSSVTPPLQRA